MGGNRIVVPKSVPFGQTRARNDTESQGIALNAEMDHAKRLRKFQRNYTVNSQSYVVIVRDYFY